MNKKNYSCPILSVSRRNDLLDRRRYLYLIVVLSICFYWTSAFSPILLSCRANPSGIYQFKARSIDGKEIDFSSYKGSVLLIVNTASECGFTSQYEGLEALYEKFQMRGLKVLGFPCNQFGQQEPGDSKKIFDFCKKNYGVTFQLFEKIDVNGDNAHPLYKYLTACAPGVLGSKSIKWNFTKFLIDRKGNVLKRFAPNVSPESIIPYIEEALK